MVDEIMAARDAIDERVKELNHALAHAAALGMSVSVNSFPCKDIGAPNECYKVKYEAWAPIPAPPQTEEG